MRYRLRTLLIVLTLAPPLLAASWHEYTRWQSQQRLKQIGLSLKSYSNTLRTYPPEAIWMKPHSP